jgi:hypothetical protein
MSEEIIKVLDALGEKFGIAINWTSENVMPYLQQLCSKYITYEIVTCVVWLLIGIFLLFIGKYLIEKAKQYWKKYEEEGVYSDFDTAVIIFGILAGSAIIVGIIVILCQTIDIVTCLTFPEKMLIEKMQSIYKTLNWR